MDYPGKVIRKTAVTPSQTSASGVWTVDDALQAVKTNTWPIAGVPNPISRSLRFNSADSAYLNRTPASVGNRQKFTISFWLKRSVIGATDVLSGAVAGNGFFVSFPSESSGSLSSTLYLYDSGAASGGWQIFSARVFRDVSAWYHIVIALDTTQSTDSNRIKVYINGVQEDIATWQVGSGASRYPSLNANIQWNNTTEHRIGHANNYGYFNGYITELYNIDGQQLAASDFGLTDPQTGAWIPKKYTGTYGTNGFYVNFSDNSSTGTLGYDYSGNSNNFTANNFSVTAGAGNDSLVDVPTPWIAYSTTGDVGGVARGNYCTLNPLDKGSAATLTNGNLDIGSASNPNNNCRGTFGMSSGKWYFEFVITSAIGGVPAFGIGSDTASLTSNFSGDLYLYLSNGTKAVNGVETAYGATFTQNDVIGVAFDADNNSITFYKNNSSQGAITGVTSGLTWRPFVHASITATITSNFGQRPFAYAPPAGFRSLCTTNLPTPTIGATSTTQAGKYFNIITWTGTNTAASRSFTGVGFQPDFVWAKIRSNSGFEHLLYDAVRGAGNDKELSSDSTGAEGFLNTDTQGYLSSFDSDGFSSTVGTIQNEWFNRTGFTYVAWNWNAGGSNATNTSGSITSTVRANTTAGFSIVTATTPSSYTSYTVGHGLGATPAMLIYKERTGTSNWQVWHQNLSAASNTIFLNTTGAQQSGAYFGTQTSTVAAFQSGVQTSLSAPFVVYCFAPIAGYSAFGSYVGNGSTDGTFVYTGFRPEFVMVKNISATSFWQINDAARNPYNLTNLALHPNTSGAEATYSNAVMDILSNGFKLRGNDTYTNTNGNIYIYAAFAEFPFKFSNAR